ncbi:hypothetical protein QQG55_20380 [Brugia pahangi]
MHKNLRHSMVTDALMDLHKLAVERSRRHTGKKCCISLLEWSKFKNVRRQTTVMRGQMSTRETGIFDWICCSAKFRDVLCVSSLLIVWN